MAKKLIELSYVTIGYSNKIVSKEINFKIFENDFIGLVGPNGAGKTTLLKTILGSLKAINGIVEKKDVTIGYVPQRDTVQPLLPYSVFDVVLMSRYSSVGTFKNITIHDKEIVRESLEKVGILNLIDYNYNSLSGGQRQRVLIARALAFEPNLLILDEPTNGMDTPSHYSLLNLISDLHEDKNLAIIMVSHLLSDVANYVKKLVLIDNGLFQFGNTDEILSEQNLKNAYSSEFNVKHINGEYLITAKKGKN
jgi:zinc transport system ATP-binding protein